MRDGFEQAFTVSEDDFQKPSMPAKPQAWLAAVPRFQQCSAPSRDAVPTCKPLGAEMPKEGLGRLIYNLPAS